LQANNPPGKGSFIGPPASVVNAASGRWLEKDS
jgi:hypothetical protein